MSETVVLQESPVGDFRAGAVIADKYRLERELGRGAMGTVWAAVHVTLGQRVAIKLISAEQAASNDARIRFGLEAKAAARLKSRHVVQVYDSGHAVDGTPYIVMEYLEGQTLEERLAEQRDIGLDEAVRITTHVGRALARAHAQGIVHRDLKSGNIFIAKSDDDEQGWVAKVLDFGVAKLTDPHAPSTTKTGAIVGTPLFMSPEQIRGASHVDHRADLYSLGIVFYNMVTGSHAFDGPSYSDVLVAICTQELPPIQKAAPWLSNELAAWFEKACAREREQRFQSADELVDALLSATGPVARPGSASAPDDGPSSTLLGHIPPHAAATVQLTNPQRAAAAASAAAVRRAPPVAISVEPEPRNVAAEYGQSARGSRAYVTPEIESTLRPPRARTPLIVWAATGVGLGVIVLLGATLLTRLGSTPERSDAASSGAVIAAPQPPPAPLPPPAPAPSPSPRAEPPPAPTADRPKSELRETAAKPAPSTRSARDVSRPKTAPVPAAPARAPAPAKGAPDMGF
jgi:eukaryotic-like serine/threonine-protein kinase